MARVGVRGLAREAEHELVRRQASIVEMEAIYIIARLYAKFGDHKEPDKIPIQVYGTDKFTQHQSHIFRAQLGFGANQRLPAPMLLTKSVKQSRSFLKRNRECGREKRNGNQCDEYPYSSTLEGGPKWADIWVSTMLVTKEEKQGGFITSFYSKASINIGDRFFVIPIGGITEYYDKYGIRHIYTGGN